MRGSGSRACADFLKHSVGVNSRERISELLLCFLGSDASSDQVQRDKPCSLNVAFRGIAADRSFGRRSWLYRFPE